MVMENDMRVWMYKCLMLSTGNRQNKQWIYILYFNLRSIHEELHFLETFSLTAAGSWAWRCIDKLDSNVKIRWRDLFTYAGNYLHSC
jgi:predicted nuclease of predicted toxin-antitoxin system